MALVALLRGVNVGGHRRFRPTELARELRHLDVRNIGAAGTFVVRGIVGRPQLEDEIRKRLPFEAEIVICDGVEVLDLLALDPFAGEIPGPDTVRFVSALAREPTERPRFPVTLPRGRWLVKVIGRHGRFAIGVYRRHMRTIGWLGALDEVFGAPVVTRNWNTLDKIAKALEGGGT